MAHANAMTLAAESEWSLPSRRKVGVIGIILTESALFTIFVPAYLFYIGKSLTGPYPKDVLELPILATICLLSSSLTVVLAERAFRRGNIQGSPDDRDKSFRNDLLLAGRLACESRDRGFDAARVGLDLEPARIRNT